MHLIVAPKSRTLQRPRVLQFGTTYMSMQADISSLAHACRLNLPGRQVGQKIIGNFNKGD
jgi:hypothetical protein